MAAYTTFDLINSVKARLMLPDASTGSFSSAVILSLATEELQGPIVAMIMAARENYYETFQDTVIASGVSTYQIPSRAIGGILSVAQYINNSRVYPLVQLEPSECISTISGTPVGFYFQNNSVVLYPTPTSSTGTLRLRYYQRPSSLEQLSNCAQVVSFDSVAKTVTVGAAPAAWTTGTVIDFIPQAVPNTPYSLDTALTGVASNVLSFSALPAALAVGDWIAIAETTPIPEILRELFPVLTQATACKLLEAAGDMQALGAAQQKLQAYIQAASKQIQPRDVLTPQKVRSNWQSF